MLFGQSTHARFLYTSLLSSPKPPVVLPTIINFVH